ncbi:Lrp/AsnC family transcriptional regulator [Pseudofulvibacter geojedonensis]|uniref:Lrp/AsnC family transcriptional regulator n=1 Tax=Pseudofulvibacter geojedonensis TaxID=1123758 RepID=A0ABW3I417_9FLAO
MNKLDIVDFKIINELQLDCKQSIKQLAQKVNLSVSPVHERIKRIENNGVIDKYVAIIKPELLGLKMVVYCQVKLIKHQEELFDEFEKYIVSLDEVLEASYIAGSFDFLIKVVLKDMDEYQYFVKHKISKLKIISNIQSSFVMSYIKCQTNINL